MSEVTAFLITCGEPTTAAALAALQAQTMPVTVETVENLAPMNVAFQAMLDRAATRFHVQVDADMLLYPHAVATLYRALADAPAEVAFVCAPLWDEFERRPLYGVKLYRTDVMRRYPYGAAYSCETEQMVRLRRDGYRWHLLPLAARDGCLGLHGTAYTPEQAFRRWKRLVVKQRRSQLASPPWGALSWTEAYYRRHAQWYREDGDPVRLAAILGMVAGLLVEPLPGEREDDYRDADPQWATLAERFIEARALPRFVTEW